MRDILWTFSGRRGVHCWISDVKSNIAFMEEEQRSAVLKYLTIVQVRIQYKAKIIHVLIMT